MMRVRRKEVPGDIIASLLENYKTPDDLLGEHGLLKQLTKQLVEKALHLEMTEHLTQEQSKNGDAENGTDGHTSRTVLSEAGPVTLNVPRDRLSRFDPQVLRKRQRRLHGFDDRVMSMYARGMSLKDIQIQIRELYGADISTSLISDITDAAVDEVMAWQARPLDNVYPIVYLDCIRVKVRDGAVRAKAVYLAIGVNMAGEKEALGIWIAQTEGAKTWMQVLTELRNRGVHDILIACVDGLKGFPEAIEAVYPETIVQLCIVHMVRNSLDYVSWRRKTEVATDLKRIYSASTSEDAEQRLSAFEKKWDSEYSTIGQSWRRNWPSVMPFFDYPAEIRKVIYTTNAIESVNMSLRRITKYRGAFPNDDSLMKLLFLGMRNISKRWKRPIRDWKAALNRFTIQFEGRLP